MSQDRAEALMDRIAMKLAAERARNKPNPLNKWLNKWLKWIFQPAILSNITDAEAALRELRQVMRTQEKHQDFSNLVVGETELMLQIPVLKEFDTSRVVGYLSIAKSVVPALPTFHFSLGFAINHIPIRKASDWEWHAVALLPDSKFQPIKTDINGAVQL